MKQLRRSEIRRRSTADEEEKGIVVDYLASGNKSSYFKLSTPLRQLQVKSATKSWIISQGSGRVSSSRRVTSTPMEIRWPLMAFFKRHNYNESFVKLLGHGSINAQNRLLIDLEEIEDIIQQLKEWQSLIRDQVVDFDIVNELKSQYVKAALKDGGSNVTNLRLCLMQYLMSSGSQLQQKLTLPLPAIPESPSVAVSISSSIALTDIYEGSVQPITPMTKSPLIESFGTPPKGITNPRTPLMLSDTFSLTPVGTKASSFAMSPLPSQKKNKCPPSSSTPSTLSNPGGDTPLHIVRQRLMTMKRLQTLRRLCPTNEQLPHIMIKAQSFIGNLDPFQPTSGSKRRLGLETQGASPASGKKRRVSLNGDASTTDYSGGTSAPISSTPAAKRKVSARGAAHLLGTKAVPKTKKKYVSRVAATQKARVTRENRALRESLHTSNGQTPVNKSKRQRRTDKFKQIQEEKFVVPTVIDYNHLKDDFEAPTHDPKMFSALPEVSVAEESEVQSNSPLKECLTTQLQTLFKMKNFRDGQLEAVTRILTRAHLRIIISLPTGSGKSLIFQMAALNLAQANKELTIAIFPTLPLLIDQTSKLTALHVLSCGALHSGLTPVDVRKTLVALRNGLLDIVLLTPEQYNSTRFQNAMSHLSSRRVGLVCIDESHCLSEWGHTFRPAYQKTLHYAVKAPRILMMTATASNATLSSMSRHIGSENLEIYKPLANTQRSDLECHLIWIQDSNNQPNDLVSLLRKIMPRRQGIILIYCWMKHITEKIARMLKEQFTEEKVIYYHSGLDEEERRRAISAFVNGTCDICVATEALGIGIDSLYVWSVIHYNLPSGIEQYTQEIGRCNRRGNFGENCLCHLLLSPTDFRARHHQTSASIIDTEAVVDCFVRLCCAEPPKSVRCTRRSQTQQEEKGIVTALNEWPTDTVASEINNNGEGSQRLLSKTIKSLSPAIVICAISATLSVEHHSSQGSPPQTKEAEALTPSIGTHLTDVAQVTESKTEHSTCLSAPISTSRDSLSLETAKVRASEPCRPQVGPPDTLNRGASRSPTTYYTMSSGKYNEVAWVNVNKAEMGQLANSRSADELQVLLTMIDNLASGTEPMHLTLHGREATSDKIAQLWCDVVSFEQSKLDLCCPASSTNEPLVTPLRENTEGCDEHCCSLTDDSYEICRVHRLQILQCHSEGVEIRCFSKPLEDWIATYPTIELLSRYWSRNASGIYKIRWIDVLTGSRISSVLVDIDLLEYSLLELANELHCHISPIASRSRIWLRFFRSRNSHKYIRSLVREACRALEVNNRVQVNRLNAGYIAFKLGVRDGSKILKDFTEDYFNWPPDLEAHESDHALWSLPRFKRFRIDTSWLHESFERKASTVIMAELRFDIEKLISLLTRDGIYVLASESNSFNQCVVTSISLARILIGAGSLRHDYKAAANLGSFWGSYCQYRFSDLRDACHKVLLKLMT